MLEQPDSPTASDTKKQVFDHYLYRLQSEIHTILAGESDYEERVRSLETDLSVFKRACFTAEAEKRRLAEEIIALKEKLETTEATNKNGPKRIVCLIDGDGAIFAPELILKKQEGGRLAAQQLSESIHYHNPSAQPCHLWTFIFFNKRGLMETFARAGGEFRGVREALDEFVLAFNQSSERFMMVDVGSGKEAADAKIKALLEDHARSPDTFKIIFGGCHDNGYMPQLQSLLTSVYRDKLILLPGYSEMASEIGKLQLPSLVIPGLFIPEKIVIQTYSRMGSLQAPSGSTINNAHGELGPPPGLPSPPPTSLSAIKNDGSRTPESLDEEFPYKHDNNHESPVRRGSPSSTMSAPTGCPTPPPEGQQQRVALGKVAGGGPVSYRNIVQSAATIPAIGNDNNQRSQTKQNGNNTPVNVQPKQRRINPDIPLSAHDPPPCTLFYLAANGCKHGADCRFGHDYILDADDYDALQRNAKKVPCPMANRGEVCLFGDGCCYGHSCPFRSRCMYAKQGKCKFSGPNMHRETTA